ncbi:hypothetical protein FMUAM8_51840 [Nocardia cyriacigeorgica]|nr:hypothetical protein FMUAM8_51840 [Nocardia cyriacigeorgica]
MTAPLMTTGTGIAAGKKSAEEAGDQQDGDGDQTEQHQQAQYEQIPPNALWLLDHHSHYCLRSPGAVATSISERSGDNFGFPLLL